MYQPALSLLAIAAALIPGAQSAAGPKGAVLKDTWQPLCELAGELDTIDGQAAKILKDIASQIKNASTDALRLQIYFATAKMGPDVDLLKPILAATAEEAADATAAIKAAASEATAATAHAGFLHGHIAEFLKIFGSAYSTTGTLPCLATTAQNGATSQQPITSIVGLAAAKCKVFKSATLDAKLSIQQIDDAGFTKLGKAVGIEETELGDTNDNCELTQHAAGSFLTGQAPNNAIPYAAGLLRLATGNKRHTSAVPKTITTVKQAAAADKDLQVLADAHAAINAFRKSQLFNVPEAQHRDLAKLKNSGAFKQGVAIYLLGSKKADGDDKLSNVDSAIEQKYGTEQDKFIQKTWAIVDNHKIDEISYDPEGKKQKPLGEITDEKQLALALQYYTQKAAAELAAKIGELEKTKDKPVNQLKDCSKLEKAACKPDVGCKYNETANKCEEDSKSTVVQANKETGGKDEKTDCSKLTTQTECEKANEGQTTKVCGWKGENTDGSDKGTYKCRDSSFLLSKHFALSVVSAAFVALLF
uniref:Variant surface glycoprotein n=1 Tax=Trypanosoma brucei TaxID=5691 RepID=S5FWV6_9TRYP|nr:variant surface glycoprotein [Trypanosoma brucei]